MHSWLFGPLKQGERARARQQPEGAARAAFLLLANNNIYLGARIAGLNGCVLASSPLERTRAEI